MHTYTINVAQRIALPHWQEQRHGLRYSHDFRVEGIREEKQAKRIASDLQRLYPDAQIEITRWSAPTGTTVTFDAYEPALT